MRAVRLAQEMQTKTSKGRDKPALDPDLRLYIYRYFIRHGRAPSAAEMANGLSRPLKQVRAALARLSATHAFVLQENGELWRAAPFSAVPTAFPVKIGRRSWYANAFGTHLASLRCSLKMPGSMRPAAAAIWRCC